MPNRGNLNWSGNNTTYNVPAGFYSGGTLDSRPSYNNGYDAGNKAGITAGKTPVYKTFTASGSEKVWTVKTDTSLKPGRNTVSINLGFTPVFAALICMTQGGRSYSIAVYSRANNVVYYQNDAQGQGYQHLPLSATSSNLELPVAYFTNPCHLYAF